MSNQENTESHTSSSDSPSVTNLEEKGNKIQEFPSPVPAPQPPTFPEGGFQAWSTLAGAWIVQFCTFGYVNSFGVYQDFYVRDYLTNYSSSDIGWIGSVQVLMLLSLGIVTGKAFDRGYFYHLMIGGSIFFGFSLFMLSLSHQNSYYQVFLSQGLAGGIACGMTYIPGLGIVSHYFQRRRALAMGIVASGSSLGAVVHPIMLNQLFHGSVGFHNGVRASAGLNLGLLLIANLMMKPRLPPKKEGAAIPIKDFARDPPYVFAVFGGFCVLCALFFPIFFLQLDAIEHGMSETFAFYSLSILNGASVVGRVLPGFLAMYFGVFNMLIIVTFCIGIMVFALAGVTTVAGTVIFAILFGFFSGAGISLLPPMLASLARNFNEIGARMGICFTFTGIAGLIGTPIAGALLTEHFIWWRPIVFSGVLTVAGAASFGIARFFVVKRKGMQKV